MNVIHIKASKHQLSKLRRGHKVRVGGAIQGKGYNLVVHPEKYDLMSKTFTRGKGMEISLSPQEISANQEATPQMGGQGIFGSKFDKFLDKRGLKEGAYAIGDALKPVAKAGIVGGLGALATGLAGTEFVATGGLGASAVPLIYGTAGSLGALGMDYLDNPSKYQPKRNAGGPRNKIAHSQLEGALKQNEVLSNLSQDTGANYNVLGKATLSNALAQSQRAVMEGNRASDLSNTYNTGVPSILLTPKSVFEPPQQPQQHPVFGLGIHHHKTKEVGSVGTGSRFVQSAHSLPPAMLSQPFSSNYQFKHTLPPAYARYVN